MVTLAMMTALERVSLLPGVMVADIDNPSATFAPYTPKYLLGKSLP